MSAPTAPQDGNPAFDPTTPAPADALAGRLIAITGASAGIGRCAAETFAAHGATVLLLARNLNALEAVYDAIVERGHPQPLIQPLDLESIDAPGCQEIAHALGDQFGRLDGLLHNASVLGPRLPLAQYDPQAWEQVMGVDLRSNFLLTQALLPLLEESEDPALVFTSSGAGLRPRAYWGAYAVAKAGVEALAAVLADELENISPVRVHSLNPGGTRTAMRAAAFPAEDPASLPSAEDLMPLYVWLFSAAARGLKTCQIDARQCLGIET